MVCLASRVAPPTGHAPSLTSLRALAAFLVFLFHAELAGLGAVAGQGRLGVSFFFVLSGLLLGLRARDGDTAGRFYRRRAARIYPAYLAALAAGVVVSTMSGEPNRPEGLAAVFLLQAWWPDAQVYFVWNAVSWSLSVEAFFYAVFPLLAPWVLGLGARATRALQGGCVAVVVGLGLWVALTPVTELARPDSVVFWAAYISPLGRLAEFVLGLALVRVARGRRLPVTRLQAGLVLLVAYLLAGLQPVGLGLAAITLVPIALVLVVFYQADVAHERSWTSWRPLVVLGEWSYCFYLVHQLALRVAERFVDGLFYGSAALVALPLALVSAWLLHELVEKPCDRRLNGRAFAHPARQV